MNFVNHNWLIALPMVIIGLIILFYSSKRIQQRNIARFISPKLSNTLLSSYSPTFRFIKSTLFISAIGLLFIALAQPQWGYKWQEQKARGIDIMIALDTSKSMLAEDIRPNRLERAKFSVLDLLKKLEGDRVGLIAFAGGAFLQCPLTLDYSAFRQSLKAVDTSIIDRGGTDIAMAIRTAEPSFAQENNFKFLILITDGEDLEKAAIEYAKAAGKRDLTIYTVGVGTSEGELIPIKKPDGSTDYVRNTEGKVVKTKLDEDTLKAIAEATGGFYVPLGSRGEGLDSVYEAGLNTIPQQDLSSGLKKVPIERFQWPLGIALFLITLESLISTRKKHFRKNITVFPTPSKDIPAKAAAITLIAILILSFSPKLEASSSKAYAKYQEGDYPEAIDFYKKALEKNPNDSEVFYNLGTSFYQNREYEPSIKAFDKALTSEEPSFQKDTFYNLGNAHFRQGELILDANPEETIALWEKALTHYQSTIDLDIEDSQAKENYAYVKKRLDELKQEQEKEKQKDEDQDDQEDQKDQEDSDDRSGNSDNNESKNNDDKNSESDNNNEEEKEDPKNNNANDNNAQNQPQDQQSPEQQQSQRPSSDTAMSPEEAKHLLNALQDSEKKLPAIDMSGNREDPEPTQDW